jgi:formylglycine-generating enzyme required for sulfatase activity
VAIPLAVKLVIAVAAGAAAAAMNDLRPPTAPPPFKTVFLSLNDGHRLEAGRDEITYVVWKDCHDAGACEQLAPAPPSLGQDYPMTRVNGQDIKQFLVWLNKKTHADWRLPTLAEWRDISAAMPRPAAKKRFTDPRLSWAADYGVTKPLERKLQPSGSFGTLPNGLRDVSGNVFEWTSTCVNPHTGKFLCPAYFVTGEHVAEIPIFLRDPVTGGCASGTPPTHLGFRLVRDV